MQELARNWPNFGHARRIVILLNTAISHHQTRLAARETLRLVTLEALDFDEIFDRLERSETSVVDLFKNTTGCERLIDILRGHQNTTRKLKAMKQDPKEQIPFIFLLRGLQVQERQLPLARCKLFFDASFLATLEVLECSASELIGQYIGHAGPKVKQQLDKALGRILFIDEAHRLGECRFAKKALDELVDVITKDRYHQRLIEILAG